MMSNRATLWMFPGAAIGIAIYLLIRKFVLDGGESDWLIYICCIPCIFGAGALGQKYNNYYRNLTMYDMKLWKRLLVEIVLGILLMFVPVAVACIWYV